MRRLRALAPLAFLAASLAVEPTGCGTSSEETPLDILTRKLGTVKTVCHSPTCFDPLAVPPLFATESDIAKDLEVLHEAGFRGVVTYGCDGTLAEIPRIARSAGFELVVMGVWDPTEGAELASAGSQSRHVEGYCLGNENLGVTYSLEELLAALDSIRSATGKPVTTAEVVDGYTPELVDACDWVFPNAHPYWNGITDPGAAAQWVADRYAAFDGRGKTVVFKEVGMPTAGEAGLSEAGQDQFFRALTAYHPDAVWAWFEAFDQPWKTHAAVEPNWGVFHADRTPKAAMK